MRRAFQLLGLAVSCLVSLTATDGRAQQAEAAKPVVDPKAAPESKADAPAKPKIGDTTTRGYFRGGFGASNQKGRMTCFQLALEGGLLSKYRLGNECEVW